jgi:CRISPR-associated endonuclease/helicase Cas3/CRISPR-associated endonuclease Cas3-HD
VTKNLIAENEYAIREAVTTIAGLHDIGKLTQWFQQYIHENDSCPRPKKYKRHSLTSAYLTYQALGQMAVPDIVQLAGFYAVAKHHGVFPDISENYS